MLTSVIETWMKYIPGFGETNWYILHPNQYVMKCFYK